MKTFKELREESFKLVDMDDASAANAQKLAKKAGLKPVVKKTKTGIDVTVVGSNNKVAKFIMSLPEQTNLEEARIPMYKPTKFEGKKFDRKKEIKSLKNMQKAIHKVAKMQDAMQYTAETGGSPRMGNPHAIYQSLVNAEQAIFDYMGGIERGYYDGIIDMDRD